VSRSASEQHWLVSGSERCESHADGQNILPGRLDSLIEEHQDAIDAMGIECDAMPTFFEVLTALAIRYFADKGVQCVLMEAGLGGITDATNVFRQSQVSKQIVPAFVNCPCMHQSCPDRGQVPAEYGSSVLQK
jgi:hypothetical protein